PEIVPEIVPETVQQETEEKKIEEPQVQTPAKVIEKTKPKKKKKFPVLLVIGGLIVVGAVVYTILLKQTKYQLTVNLGEGVNGSPTGGVYSYKRGSNVGYNYTAQTGYGAIRVMIDGQIAPASGSINMKGNHSLNVTATKLGVVNVKSTPTGAQIIVDGANSGLLTNNTVNFSTAGSHTILLRKLGFKEDKNTLNIVLGETKTLNKTLKRGLLEDFNNAAASSLLWKWKPHSSGNWSVSDGKYIANAKLKEWNYSVYDYNFAAPKYTLTVKMKRTAGNKFNSNGIILATGASPTAVSGYLFNYTTEGAVSIFEVDSFNFSAGNGDFSTILNWTDSAAVNRGMGSYNTIKLVRNGADYTYYVNNQKIRSFKNAKHNPAFIYISGYNGNITTKLEYDYVYLDIDTTTDSIAGEPVELIKSTQPVHIGYHKK
ncbi:MAG: PEGA domain-containing protein, partial [Candidatus Aminicenantes bacterium]|nr:PEGA domain-containing protein [Candidatus Aminicenantes bacterium]